MENKQTEKKESPYITYVKQYAKDNNMSYRDAIKKAKVSYKELTKDKPKRKYIRKIKQAGEDEKHPYFIFVNQYAKDHKLGYKDALKEIKAKKLYVPESHIPQYEPIFEEKRSVLNLRVKHAIINIVRKHPSFFAYNSEIKERLKEAAGSLKAIKTMDPNLKNKIIIDFYKEHSIHMSRGVYNFIMNNLFNYNREHGISNDNLHVINLEDKIYLFNYDVYDTQFKPGFEMDDDSKMNVLFSGYKEALKVKQLKDLEEKKRIQATEYIVDKVELKNSIMPKLFEVRYQDFNNTKDTIRLLRETVDVLLDAISELKQEKILPKVVEKTTPPPRPPPEVYVKKPRANAKQPAQVDLYDLPAYRPKKQRKKREAKKKNKPEVQPEVQPNEEPEPVEIKEEFTPVQKLKIKNQQLNELRKQREETRETVDKMTDKQIIKSIFKIHDARSDILRSVIDQEYDPDEIPADVPSDIIRFERYIDKYFKSSDELKDFLYKILTFE